MQVAFTSGRIERSTLKKQSAEHTNAPGARTVGAKRVTPVLTEAAH
ncbi:MAG TPA: hypothetical protein VFA28_10850 [Bryobacteraceae bacterium]|nr:hypothetical protein [Bryobacteraceae bacterium]